MPGRCEDVDAIATAVGLPSSEYPVNTYVDAVVAGLLRPLVDQDLSLVFYDLTTQVRHQTP